MLGSFYLHLISHSLRAEGPLTLACDATRQPDSRKPQRKHFISVTSIKQNNYGLNRINSQQQPFSVTSYTKKEKLISCMYLQATVLLCIILYKFLITFCWLQQGEQFFHQEINSHCQYIPAMIHRQKQSFTYAIRVFFLDTQVPCLLF